MLKDINKINKEALKKMFYAQKEYLNILDAAETQSPEKTFILSLNYDKETARQVGTAFGNAAEYDKYDRIWHIKAIPSVIDTKILIDNLRRVVVDNTVFITNRAYSLIEEIKKQDIQQQSNNI